MMRTFPALVLSVWLTSPVLAGEADVASLIADLKKSDADKVQAAEKLEALGPKAAAAAPALIELFAAKNEDVRLRSALALGKIGKAAVEPLTAALQKDDADVRFYATQWATSPSTGPMPSRPHRP